MIFTTRVNSYIGTTIVVPDISFAAAVFPNQACVFSEYYINNEVKTHGKLTLSVALLEPSTKTTKIGLAKAND